MSSALEKLSKKELIALLENQQNRVDQVAGSELDEKDKEYRKRYEDLLQKSQNNESEIYYLKAQIEQYKRLLYGQKRERFEGNKDQLPLPFEATAEEKQEQQEQFVEKISYVRKKQKSAHKGRTPLPDHLPVEEIVIDPEEDTSDMVCIGKEVTEELECIPAKFYIKRYIRYKYAPKKGEGIVIANLPERVINKGIPGPGLLATILIDKYMDHLPLYRIRQRFKRENIPIASSTIEGWTRQSLDLLVTLYEHLEYDTLKTGYLQVDETPMKVMDSNKKGACHQGYYWVYHNPIEKTVLFDYQPTRGALGVKNNLSGFKGYLQTDGYGVYDKIGLQPGVTHLSCWVHARREFEKALSNKKEPATIALTFIQRLYEIERIARDEKMDAAARKKLRLDNSLIVINSFGMWLAEAAKEVYPQSQIAKAINYTINRWDKLSVFLHDGTLEIDNNLVENAIRPVALGRKNYLFAGSHSAAQRAAVIYSFFAICKKHEINPYQWLKYTLENIMTINHKDVRKLYPQNFNKINK